jgi:acetyl esterase/lipase
MPSSIDGVFSSPYGKARMSAALTGTRRLGLTVLILLSCHLYGPAAASALTVPSTSLSLPIQVLPSYGGFPDGTATMGVTYTDTAETVTAGGTQVALGSGNAYKLSTCLTVHVVNSLYDSSCSDRIIDTHGNSGSVAYTAPTVTKAAARPASAAAGYASSVVSVRLSQADGSWKEIATSWPAAGLSVAGVGLVPQGLLTALPPRSQGAALPSTVQTGGINTGLPDSFCGSDPRTSTQPVEPGTSTSGLGSDAPAYYEVGQPTGTFAGLAPKGIMLVINGGGWFMNGSGSVEYMRPDADRWRSRGWETLNLTYRPCGNSFVDVRWFYDRARQLWGSTLPYCAMGGSAGGHLALELAAARSSLACVDNESGPTDALSLTSQTAYNVAGPQHSGPNWVYNMMTAAWGQENLVWVSPALFSVKARVLMGVGATDPYIPWAQATELKGKMLAADANAYVDIAQLAAGTVAWVHTNVSQAAIDDWNARETNLVAPLVHP